VLVVCNAGNHDKIAVHFERRLTGRARFDDASDRTALLALQGPRALEVVGLADAAGGERARALGSFRFAELTLLGKACTVARTGYTGEDGVEIFCAGEDAAGLWRGLLEAGAGVGIEPVGLGARDTLRLEARLALYGNDIDETTNPFEAGLGWTVKLDKSSFVGKAALEHVKAQGIARRLVGFEMTGRGVARHGYPLLSPAGNPVGVCTSGAPSPTLGKSIGLGYLPRELSEVGTDFLVDCRGRAVPARVVPTPFYKRATTS
jgi:aminomethyltransferase